jgi:hypothetical protein
MYLIDQTSGILRPAYNTDFAANNNISVSGLSLTVGAVNLTGTNPVTVTGFNTGITVATRDSAALAVLQSISGKLWNGNPASSPINVSGVVQASVSIGNVAVTGGGTFTPTFAILTGSQQVINAGYKSASVAVISGSAYINGSGPYLDGVALSFGGYGGFLSATPLVVGCTGSTGAPCSTYVIWET